MYPVENFNITKRFGGDLGQLTIVTYILCGEWEERDQIGVPAQILITHFSSRWGASFPFTRFFVEQKGLLVGVHGPARRVDGPFG